jgi:[glutamine synthetase] adenylyltransferase / [glutamine synthetase]-adenylyl-L-tyrosine phosphorylase
MIMTVEDRAGSRRTSGSSPVLAANDGVACMAADTSPPVANLAAHSRFWQRVQRRFAAERQTLAAGVPSAPSMAQALSALRAQGHGTGAALRVLRALVVARLIELDCDARAPLSDVVGPVSDLAELALHEASVAAQAELDAEHGMPTKPDGSRCAVWIVGMGKLGARELNVSSDIDLIFVYECDGQTRGQASGRGSISHAEYFARLVRRVTALIGEVTEHGFVFRVDLALRPNGQSGPPALPLSALEEYFMVQGREWERFAWLKSRVVAPRYSLDSAHALRPVVLPFVFRRYLDYGVFEALRVLHRQIREQAGRRSAGRPARANDVKLSRGGIREVEFIVQLLQVVRGGQFPELRTRPTLDALDRLSAAGLVPAATAAELAQAYIFLRRTEHRIQYLDDQQTHALPDQDGDLDWLARSLDLGDAAAFLQALDGHRERVATEFDRLLGGGSARECRGPGCGTLAGAGATDLAMVVATAPPEFAQRVRGWSSHPRVLALREDARQRLVRLMQRTLAWLAEERVTVLAAMRSVDWLEPLLRREAYLALLLEHPQVHERLLRLLGAARWPAVYMRQHPGVIDELASELLLSERFDAVAFEHELQHRRDSLAATGEDDDETLMDLLRRAHHAEVFRTLARDVEGCLSVEKVADDLSALADSVLAITQRWCWSRYKKAHRPQPRLAIISYGKLGGKELGYGSDLDLVFVHDDADERAPEVYADFVRKLITWLTTQTREGALYDIDTALRPNGNAGLLVTSLDAFANYQLGRGSNAAWTWEHQAMTRARCSAGPPDLAQRIHAVRAQVLAAPRDAAVLRGEIVAMREKVRAAHPVAPGRFDVKHSPGGMVDLEFALQCLLLAHAGQHAELLDNLGTMALLRCCERLGLLPGGLGEAAAAAYRDLRRAQHQARLDEAPTQLDPAPLQAQQQVVLQVWHAVMGPSASVAKP